MHHRAFGWPLAAAGAAALCGSAARAGGPCEPDFDGSGDVDIVDLLNLLSDWGPGDFKDLNGDNVVDVFDLVLLLDCWGPCPCGPPTVPERFDATVTVDATDATAAGLGLVVTHLYATGATVSVGDRLLAVEAELAPTAGTSFYQDVVGSSVPPTQSLCDVFPALCYDTFVTMQDLVDDGSSASPAPGFAMSTASISGSWFVIPTDPDAEAVDISGLTGNPGQAGVLIAQVTMVLPAAAGPSSVGYGGTLRTWTDNAGGRQGAQQEMAFNYCPWDCQDEPDGEIGINDFLRLLGQWDGPGSCDLDYDGVVGILDFLEILTPPWGPCPG